MTKITWREVLDSQAKYAKNWKHITKFLPIVDITGYEYFCWNGLIMKLIHDRSELGYWETGLTVKDLDTASR